MQHNIHPVVQKDRLYEELPVYKSDTFTKAEEARFQRNIFIETKKHRQIQPILIDKQEPENTDGNPKRQKPKIAGNI